MLKRVMPTVSVRGVPVTPVGTLFDLIYPVGSIYMSVNNVSPANLFGGTWERIEGSFLLAATENASSTGASQSAGTTGGEASHTLSESEMPSHNHNHSEDSTSTKQIGLYSTEDNKFYRGKV